MKIKNKIKIKCYSNMEKSRTSCTSCTNPLYRPLKTVQYIFYCCTLKEGCTVYECKNENN